jgi:hypothetical protein
MTTEEMLREKLPGLNMERHFGGPSYSSLTALIGAPLLSAMVGSPQGDVYELVRGADGRVGFLCFGYGSCSGCDAIEACNSYGDLAEVFERLRDDVRWFDAPAAALKFFHEHDWHGDACEDEAERQTFIDGAIALLKSTEAA